MARFVLLTIIEVFFICAIIIKVRRTKSKQTYNTINLTMYLFMFLTVLLIFVFNLTQTIWDFGNLSSKQDVPPTAGMLYFTTTLFSLKAALVWLTLTSQVFEWAILSKVMSLEGTQ